VAEVDRLGWAVTVPLRAGNHILGVRANSVWLGELLRELFAERVVPDAQPPANLSVLLAPQTADGTQDLHRVYVTHRRTLRSRSALRTLDALWHELDLWDVEVARQRMLVDATVLVRTGTAHVLPAGMRGAVADHQRRWSREGFRLVDRRKLDLDLSTATITIPPSGLTDDREALQRCLAAAGIDHRAELPQPTGNFPIASWVLPPGQRTLAGRVVDAAGQIVDRPAHDGVAMLRELSALLAGLPDIVGGVPEEVRDQLMAA
jgi:hypothetical protein